MKAEFSDAIRKGSVISVNTFETAKGVYKIFHVRYCNYIYLIKLRDDKILECKNLSKMPINSSWNYQATYALNDLFAKQYVSQDRHVILN